MASFVLALVACNGPASNQPPATNQPQVLGVPWGDYAPGVQTRIDELKSTKDCTSMQAEFDAADANNAAMMDRVGHSNADLMGYIDAAMRSAGCY